jgi:hypothetical protein
MRRTLRLLILGLATSASLAFAGTALPKTPQLLVVGAAAPGASAQTTVEVKEEKTDAAPFRITIYVPPTYVINLSQSAGTQIGTVDAMVQLLGISFDTLAPATGQVVVGDRTSSTLQTSAAQCTGTPTHAAIWMLNVTLSGQTLPVPAYVDPTSRPEADFSSAKLVFCLPNPYEQAQPPSSRAAFGAKIVDAKLTLSAGVLTNPSLADYYRWRSVITPWTVNGSAPNPAGTIETQAIVANSASLTLKGKLKTVRHKKGSRTAVTNSVLLSGRLLVGTQGGGGVKVAFFVNGKSAGSATTNSTGVFSKTFGLRKKSSFRVTATVPIFEIPVCGAPLSALYAPAGCVGATTGGYKLTSNTVAFKPKTR